MVLFFRLDLWRIIRVISMVYRCGNQSLRGMILQSQTKLDPDGTAPLRTRGFPWKLVANRVPQTKTHGLSSRCSLNCSFVFFWQFSDIPTFYMLGISPKISHSNNHFTTMVHDHEIGQKTRPPVENPTWKYPKQKPHHVKMIKLSSNLSALRDRSYGIHGLLSRLCPTRAAGFCPTTEDFALQPAYQKPLF